MKENKMEYNDVYKKLKEKQQIAFIPFTMLGFPDYDTSLEVIKTIIDNGADILELGLPFSDPVADGPIIQEANNIALENGINTEKCFELIADIREYSEIPIGLLVYGNLVYSYGTEQFYQKLGELKINSILIPDVPFEEMDEFLEIGNQYGVQSVFIITPITPENRMNDIIVKTNGFIYMMSRLGVTGTHKSASTDLSSIIQQVKSKTSVSINVGFGISQPEHVTNLKKIGADGAIIGSAIIKLIKNNIDDKDSLIYKLTDYLKSIVNCK